MKNKSLILLLFFVINITACNRKDEVYESKDVEVESVFDKIETSETDENKTETEKYSETSIKRDETEELSEDDVSEAIPETEETVTTSKMTLVNLNLRSSPEIKEDNILMVIPSYSTVKIIKEDVGTNKKWVKIETNGYEGYVDSGSLTEINE